MQQGLQYRPLPPSDAALVKQQRRQASPLSIDPVSAEPAEERIERIITENPIVIFSRRGCCMCHVMRRLLAAVGAHPTVIELEEAEAAAELVVGVRLPAAFVGGELVGGVEELMEMHVSERLVPRLKEAGALWG